MRYIFFLIYFSASVIQVQAQTGCTDAAANNYDSTAITNDGSCTYNNAAINPKLKYNLTTTLNETSGLTWWDKKIWTHNDSGNDPLIYALDNATGNIIKTVAIKNASNIDWEDMAQDEKYIYIGDFGNNANGNRTNLKIYKIKKKDIKAKDSVNAEIINFAYADQIDFTPKGSNNTNFDCEAMITFGDSIFLFSKNWVDNKTRLYKLPKTPGTYSAENMADLDVQGLITGADIVAEQKIIILTGYSSSITPFIYLLYDFSGNDFFVANKRKISINQSFTQVEGVCALSATKYYISNEKFQQLFINTPAKMQSLNLSSFLNPYLSNLDAGKKRKAFY